MDEHVELILAGVIGTCNKPRENMVPEPGWLLTLILTPENVMKIFVPIDI
jgi:hypothetical protein